jgi:hypothetical protein
MVMAAGPHGAACMTCSHCTHGVEPTNKSGLVLVGLYVNTTQIRHAVTTPIGAYVHWRKVSPSTCANVRVELDQPGLARQ